jgi:hypothetical protein
MFLHSMTLLNMRRTCVSTHGNDYSVDDAFFGNHLMD